MAAIDEQLRQCEATIERDERWEERRRVVRSTVPAFDNVVRDADGTIDLSDEATAAELADGALWRRLCRYASKPNYLLGTALSQPSVTDGGRGEVCT